MVVGFDGIVFVNAKAGPKFALTREQMYKATAKDVFVGGKLVPNPYKAWSDVDPSLPKEPILVYGPAPNHGTRDAYVELVLDPACEAQAEVKALDKDAKKKACNTVREDGAWVEVSENYTVIQQKITANPAAVGVITFSYLDQNADKIQGATVDGQIATYDNIARIITKQLDPMTAMMTRKLQVHGSMAMMMRNVPTVLDFVRCCNEITGEVL